MLFRSPEIATARPAAMMESGPVGGIIASAQVGCALGFRNVISFDMGGTTAKASLVREGEPTMAPGYHVGNYASGHPVIDLANRNMPLPPLRRECPLARRQRAGFPAHYPEPLFG